MNGCVCVRVCVRLRVHSHVCACVCVCTYGPVRVWVCVQSALRSLSAGLCPIKALEGDNQRGDRRQGRLTTQR